MTGRPIGAMEWREALFLHWPVEPARLRPMIPAGVTLQTYDGTAWVSIVAFRLAAARPFGVPAALGMPAFGEVNLRTYVGAGERDGVWFFSLDAASRLGVEAARLATHLPYYRARIVSRWEPDSVQYDAQRHDRRGPPARFTARATFAGDVRVAAPGSLDAWLVERYALFAVDPRGTTKRIDVRHAPWLLRNARVGIVANTLLQSAGIVPSTSEPLVHVSPGVSARAWLPVAVSPGDPAASGR